MGTMGTRFVATVEAPVLPSIKSRLASPEADEYATSLILGSFSNSTRVMKNPVSEKVLELEAADADFTEIHPFVKGENSKKSFQETGSWEDSTWSCGQSVALINDVPTCKELVERIVGQAESLLSAGARMSLPGSK